MKRQKLEYEVMVGEEYQRLKSDLIKVQESIGNFSFSADIKQPTSKDAFFKVCCYCALTIVHSSAR